MSVSFLSRDGTRILLQGSSGATHDEVVAACRTVLSTANLRPELLSREEAREEWSARGSEAWLSRDELWKLSWSEAETFADRIVAVLVEEHGESARALRALLVESCFEGVRPGDGSGPVSTRWKKGASAEVRRQVILAEAREQLDEEQVSAIAELLGDGRRVGAIMSAKE